MDKQAIFTTILETLKAELQRKELAARDAAANATDEESRAEDKYDTRATESSYLARGQAMQVEELAEAVRILDGFSLPAECSMTRPGALVEVEMDGDALAFFLLPKAGGLDVIHGDIPITVVTPSSPVGEQLQMKSAGEHFELPSGARGRILNVF